MIADLSSLLGGDTGFAITQSGMQTTLRPTFPARLITLTGAGGSGKTRLACQVAMEALENFADGVCFIELASLRDPSQFLNTVAKALGVLGESGRPLLATLLDWLAAKRILLILDNCEHLLDACAHFVSEAMQTSRTLYFLVTSREALSIAGELTYPIPLLDAPPASLWPITMADVIQFEAVRLFIDRAQMVLPTFRLTETNAQAIAEICRRLDGIPLAIELAAVRVSTLPVETIAARLDDRFRLLGEDNRRALPRHKTLRALIDWSYEQLALSERLLLRRLAIFAGGWTIASAEGVCGDGENLGSSSTLISTAHSTLPTSDVLTSLIRLTGKSLVVLDERDGVARYRMLETIRQYALEELQKANEVDILSERHLHYFLDLAAQSEPLFNRGQRSHWLQRLGAEHDNLRVALAWACDHNPEAAYQLTGLLRWFWYYSDYQLEAIASYTRLHSLPVAAISVRARALVLLGEIMFVFNTSPQEIEQMLAQSHALWLEVGDNERLSEAVLWIADKILYRYSQGDICLFFAQHETLLRQSADPFVLAYALTDWGWALSLGGQSFERARSLHAEALAIGYRWQDPVVLGIVYQNLGHLSLAQRDFANARHFSMEAAASYRRAGVRWYISESLYNTADVLSMDGDYAQARAYYLEALSISRACGRRTSAAYTLARLGYLSVRDSNFEEASDYFEQSLAIYLPTNTRSGITHCLTCYADMFRAQGHPALAVRLLAVDELHQSPYPFDHILLERVLDAARAPLSVVEFEAAWSAGKQMTLEDALLLARTPVRPSALAASITDVSYATSRDMIQVAPDTNVQQHLLSAAAQPSEVHKKSKSFGLSRREIEVAQLITQGHTNRVIASELVLSERTVENHIANIMTKLNFNTRSQIAAWVVEVGLQKQK